MYIYIYPVFNPLLLEKTILIHSSIETDGPKSTRSISNQFILQQPKKRTARNKYDNVRLKKVNIK